jgi:hypothetical protein
VALEGQMMEGKRFLVGFAALALTVGGGTMANEIYKWVDDQGNVHYEDRPSGSATEERLALSSRRTESGAVQERIDSRLDAQATRQEKKAAAAEEAAAAAAKEAEAAEKQKNCDTYRARLQSFDEARRLYREDEDGERVYLDDTQRQDARQKVEERIAENCTS